MSDDKTDIPIAGDDEIVELVDMVVEPPDDEVIDLTEMVDVPEDPDDEIIDLTEPIEAPDDPDDEIIDLTEPIEAPDDPDDEIIDLTEPIEALDDHDDEIIDLTEPTDVQDGPETTAIDLADTADSLDSLDDEGIDLADTVDSLDDLDDDGLDLADTVGALTELEDEPYALDELETTGNNIPESGEKKDLPETNDDALLPVESDQINQDRMSQNQPDHPPGEEVDGTAYTTETVEIVDSNDGERIYVRHSVETATDQGPEKAEEPEPVQAREEEPGADGDDTGDAVLAEDLPLQDMPEQDAPENGVSTTWNQPDKKEPSLATTGEPGEQEYPTEQKNYDLAMDMDELLPADLDDYSMESDDDFVDNLGMELGKDITEAAERELRMAGENESLGVDDTPVDSDEHTMNILTKEDVEAVAERVMRRLLENERVSSASQSLQEDAHGLDDRIAAAVSRVVEDKFMGRIRDMIRETIEKAVTEEIDRLKRLISDTA